MARYSGFGVLRSGGEVLGKYRFELADHREAGDLLVARGALFGESAGLAAAYDSNDVVTLTRDDTGFAMRLVIVEVSHDGWANVTVSGPPK